ncbi:hypothetical protein Nepgr_028256 [Nepenthes gracilis]|uniref:Nuclear factor related to kappa-B-binding protein second winged helix domain-containing protein n=1 Tax=Nepenthes gracilis TaxID=150966 RepID=A0AAD3Y289_NEPGR|nr:hypothetical protein Nepgr_028256 [Nepenthes gracilis]
MDHYSNNGYASGPASGILSLRRPFTLVARKCDDSTKLRNLGSSIDSVQENVLEMTCESSCEELACEVSSEREIDAAHALLKMSSGISALSTISRAEFWDGSGAKCGLVDDLGLGSDDVDDFAEQCNDSCSLKSLLELRNIKFSRKQKKRYSQNDDGIEQSLQIYSPMGVPPESHGEILVEDVAGTSRAADAETASETRVEDGSGAKCGLVDLGLGSDDVDDFAEQCNDSCLLKSFLERRNIKFPWKQKRRYSQNDDGIEQSLESHSLMSNYRSANICRRRKIRKIYFSHLREEEEKDDDNEAYNFLDGRKLAASIQAVASIFSSSGKPFLEYNSVKRKQKWNVRNQESPSMIPIIHGDFSFCIVHLLSAVRTALITPRNESFSQKQQSSNLAENLPSLELHEIVERVRSNPGDPRILHTHKPLNDLVGGVLKVFSSKSAPKGAKGWKILVFYEKSCKYWSWIGPIPSIPFRQDDTIRVETSPEAWGLSFRILMKLVDSFANWLKSDQERLQKLSSLPSPPPQLPLMLSTTNRAHRCRDVFGKKCIPTITPSSDEVRAYFRQEELIRYIQPDRAFSYTAIDGRKSTVAPLRKYKPHSRARDHFLLKPDRPGSVTLLCLVRDAAARLPGCVGTRGDVCVLVRDSQYIKDGVSDIQMNQVVSGALDRLHYELDPCVQFDKDRKLWVYLHGEREEEAFDG